MATYAHASMQAMPATANRKDGEDGPGVRGATTEPTKQDKAAAGRPITQANFPIVRRPARGIWRFAQWRKLVALGGASNHQYVRANLSVSLACLPQTPHVPGLFSALSLPAGTPRVLMSRPFSTCAAHVSEQMGIARM